MTDVTVPPPLVGGWAGAALAIHSIRQIPRPILVVLEPEGCGQIVIDFRDNTYAWDRPLSRFPADAEAVGVGTHALDPESPPLARQVEPLDPLLWLIGLHASYASGRAQWLRIGDKYRLKRWPDLDLCPHTPQQRTLVKTLAKSLMTVDKLARLAQTDEESAQAVVNSLSLMSALRRIESANSAPTLPPASQDFQPRATGGRHSARRGA